MTEFEEAIKNQLQTALLMGCDTEAPTFPMHYQGLLGLGDEDWSQTLHEHDVQLAMSQNPWLRKGVGHYVWASREDWIAQAVRMVGQELVTQWLLEWES